MNIFKKHILGGFRVVWVCFSKQSMPPLTRSLMHDGLFYQCFTVFDNLCYQATCHSVTNCQCVTPSFSIAFPTCKARKLHKYFIQGSILLCTDSMGKDINSRVLIMQRGDTDLILCLSTCTDILMHSVPATLWHTGDFHTLCSKAGKGNTSCWQRLPHCLNHFKILMKILEQLTAFLETLWKYISSFLQRECEC